MVNDYFSQQKSLVKDVEASLIKGVRKATAVEMQKDYANDDQICLTSVVFVPKNISQKISKDIVGLLEKNDPAQYYYSSDSMHLTVKNVRVIKKPPSFSEEDISKVDKLFSELFPQFPKFEFSIEDIILWPTSISVMAYCNDTLQELVNALDNGLKEIGMTDDKKYASDAVYFGNITICRFTQNPKEELLETVKKLRNHKIGKMMVEKISLVTCNAVCYPGSRKIIGEYELK
jgi:2'-5' RNA ligase